MAEAMTKDTRHLAKIRGAADRSLNNPDSGERTPAAQRKVEIITPARHAARTTSPVSKR